MADFIGLFGEKFEEELTDEEISVSEPSAGHLPPECAEGNVEYKLKLVNPTPSRFEHLVTQMKWRLREGNGEAIYELGVEDKGMCVGLTESEAISSLSTLCLMAEKLSATLTVLRERTVGEIDESNEISSDGIETENRPEIRKVLEVLVRKVPEDQDSVELRVAVLGNMEVGKSTLLGVLTHGQLDNGRGSARLNLFRHRHEVQSGRTSSISREILGFSADGQPLTYSTFRSPEEICEAASKLITFIDLAGHHKYLRTTIFGLMGHLPHVVLLLVSAVSGIAGTTREHLSLAKVLDLPVVVIVSKIDLVSDKKLQETKDRVDETLKSFLIKRIPMRIDNKDDALTAAASMSQVSVAPVFYVSSMTGYGLDLLQQFFNVLPPRMTLRERENLLQMDSEFQTDETFHVPNVGSVVGGLLVSGSVKTGDRLSVGPFENGVFKSVTVNSVHRNRVPCRLVRAGESATLAFSDDVPPLRRGMVLLSPNLTPELLQQYTCLYFQARIHVLFHPTAIYSGYQATCYVGSIRQTAVVIAMMGKVKLATNETASVMLRFLCHPEFVRPSSRLLIREGVSKAIGHVTQVFPFSPHHHRKQNDRLIACRQDLCTS